MLTRTLLPVLALGMSALAMATEADKKAIMANYAAYDKALNARKISPVKAMLASDCTFKPKNGQPIKAADALQAMEAQFKMAKSISSKTTVKSLKITGNTATAVTVNVGTVVAVNPNTKKDVKFAIRTESVNNWVKQNGKWLMKLVEQKAMSVTQDGKPMGR